MWRTISACLLVLGCGSTTTLEASPGRAEISMNGSWIQGRPTEVSFQWSNGTVCNFDEWFCRWPEGLTTTVLAVSCHGCTVLDDPTGTTAWSMARRTLTAVATTDGTISVDIALRFDATGDERTVSATARGDHEVALEADCRLIDLAEMSYGATTPAGRLTRASAVRACTLTRLPTEAVAVFPAVRTYRGERYFPFCFSGWSCTTGWNESLRPLEQLAMTPAPAGWGQVAYSPGATLVYFAAYPGNLPATIELSAPLLSGEMSSTSVVMPSLADPHAGDQAYQVR